MLINSNITLEDQEIIIAGLEQEWQEFSGTFYQLLPTRVRVGMLMRHMQETMDVIAEFMPINSIVSTWARNQIQNSLVPPDEFTNTFSNYGSNYQVNQYWDTLREGDFNTLQNLNTSVSYYELGVLTFNINWGALEQVAGLATAVLRPALDILSDCHSDMGEFITDSNKTRLQASTKQFEWTNKLYTAKGLLQGYTAESEGDDAFEMAAEQAQVDEIFQELQVMIEEHHESNPHELAQQVANDRLGNFQQLKTGFSANSIARLLGGAQSIRLSMQYAKSQDAQLAAKCKQFMDAVEGLEGFDDMKEFFESMFNGLENSELGELISGALRLGNLSTLLSELGGWEDLATWLINCYSKYDVEEIDKIIEAKKREISDQIAEALSFSLKIPSLSEWKAWQETKKQVMDFLKDKWEMYEKFIESLEDPAKLLKLGIYELDVEDPCSFESISKAINELIHAFVKDVEEAFEELSANAGGLIVAILLIILTDWLTSQLNSLIQQFGLDTLFGNALKALLNMIAMILVVMNGAKIYMQYLAVKALYNEVNIRREFCIHMHSEIDYLVTLLLQMQLADFGKKDEFMEIVESMKWVRKSRTRVGIELGKALNGKQPSKGNLVLAENYIQNAINALSPTEEQNNLNNVIAINQLLDEFEIDVDLFLFTDKELEDLTRAVRARFFAFTEEEHQALQEEAQQDDVVIPNETYLDENAYQEWYDAQQDTYGEWASQDDAVEEEFNQLVMCQLPTAEQQQLLENGVDPGHSAVWPPHGATVQMTAQQCTEQHGNYEGGPNPNEDPGIPADET